MVAIYGRLTNKTGSPVNATISVGSISNSTEVNGDYSLQIPPGTYDIRYGINKFIIPGFYIKLPSISISSDLKDLVSSVTQYSPQNNKYNISFSYDDSKSKIVQTYSSNKPSRVIINGTNATEVNSLSQLKGNNWFFNLTEMKLYILIDNIYDLPGYYIGQYDNGTYYVFDGQNYTNDPSYASALINNAMVYVSTHGGGTITIRNGSYLLNTTLIPQSNVYLQVSPSATIYENTPANLDESFSLLLATTDVQNFTLDGGTWNANKGSLSDHRWGTPTWGDNFVKYLGIAFYGGTYDRINIKNVVLENVIGQGIDLRRAFNSRVYNCTVINAGDNPITIEGPEGGTDENYNTIVEYCNVTGGQDVGINTFHANSCIIRYNTVSNVMQHINASHWGIAAENSRNITIVGNKVSGCSYNIVSVSDDTYIANNIVDGTNFKPYGMFADNAGIQIQTARNNVVYNNTIVNCQYPLATYGNTGTFDGQFINNTINSMTGWQMCIIGGTRITISGGTMNSNGPNGAISLQSAKDVNIISVTFQGNNGIMDYGQESDNIYIAYNNFSALTGTKVSLDNCDNVTLSNNIGYP